MLTIIGLLTGLAGPISAITTSITNLQLAKVKAESDQEKQRIDAQIAEAHARQSVLVAEAWSRINMMMRAFLAAGPAIYLFKVFVWDKVIGSFAGYTHDIFTTDPLDDNLWKVVVAVIAFYFVYDIAASFRRGQ